MTDVPPHEPFRPKRRDLFTAVGAAAVAGTAGWALGRATLPGEQPPFPVASPTPLDQADQLPGITYPAIPQRHALVTVISVPGMSSGQLLDAVRDVTAAEFVVPDDAGEVTRAVGFSSAHAHRLWPQRASAGIEVPAFRNDAAELLTGGDLMIQVCAETGAATQSVTDGMLAGLDSVDVVWQRSGYRDAPKPEGTARTSTGFIDGIINPRSTEELSAGVWVDAVSRDTYVVVRRMTVGETFLHSTTSEQEAAIGRRRDTGAPLSGGGTLDEVDLFAKTDDGHLLTPTASHVRRAHPANLGQPLMLRRSYSYDVVDGAGFLFIAFMKDPEMFIATQHRLDEQDAFISQTTTDASGCFFVPGALDA